MSKKIRASGDSIIHGGQCCTVLIIGLYNTECTILYYPVSCLFSHRRGPPPPEWGFSSAQPRLSGNFRASTVERLKNTNFKGEEAELWSGHFRLSSFWEFAPEPLKPSPKSVSSSRRSRTPRLSNRHFHELEEMKTTRNSSCPLSQIMRP